MASEIPLARVRPVLEDLSYPLTRVDAATSLEEYTLTFADGENNLGALVSETDPDAFDGPEEVEAELHALLGTAATDHEGNGG